MADNSKYLDPLKNVASGNWKPVTDAFTAWGLAKQILNGQATHVRVSIDDWFALGEPPAQKDGNRYIIDVSDPRVVAFMWGKTIAELMNLGCYAATDISDSINMINNDNLDHVITDREAMIAVSQIMMTGMDAFQKMKAQVDSVIKGE